VSLGWRWVCVAGPPNGWRRRIRYPGGHPMAWLEQDPTSGRFKICFRWGDRQFKKTVKTNDLQQGQAILLRAEENIGLIGRGRLPPPPDADIATFLLSDGRLAQLPKAFPPEPRPRRRPGVHSPLRVSGRPVADQCPSGRPAPKSSRAPATWSCTSTAAWPTASIGRRAPTHSCAGSRTLPTNSIRRIATSGSMTGRCARGKATDPQGAIPHFVSLLGARRRCRVRYWLPFGTWPRPTAKKAATRKSAAA
jgi:hypothetical protein